MLRAVIGEAVRGKRRKSECGMEGQHVRRDSRSHERHLTHACDSVARTRCTGLPTREVPAKGGT